MRNDARPIGPQSPGSPMGGPPSPKGSGEASGINRGPEEEPKREEPPQKRPERKEPEDPTMPSDDPTIRTKI